MPAKKPTHGGRRKGAGAPKRAEKKINVQARLPAIAGPALDALPESRMEFSSRVTLMALATRLEKNPTFCASAVAEFRDRRGWTLAQVAEYLGCDMEALARVMICTQPTCKGLDFEADEADWWKAWSAGVEKIAAHCHVSPTLLAAILNDEIMPAEAERIRTGVATE